MVKEEKKDRFVIEEIATQTSFVIKDNETDDRFDLQQALCTILNNQEKILSKLI